MPSNNGQGLWLAVIVTDGPLKVHGNGSLRSADMGTMPPRQAERVADALASAARKIAESPRPGMIHVDLLIPACDEDNGNEST